MATPSAVSRRAALAGATAMLLAGCSALENKPAPRRTSVPAPEPTLEDLGVVLPNPIPGVAGVKMFSRFNNDSIWQTQFNNARVLHGEPQALQLAEDNGTGGVYIFDDGSDFAWGDMGVILGGGGPMAQDLVGTSDPDAVSKTAGGSEREQALARSPQGEWSGVWTDLGGSAIDATLTRARNEGTRPLFVIYGLRQTTAAVERGEQPVPYADWVRIVSEQMTADSSLPPVVILEPDELAIIGQGEQYADGPARLAAIRTATADLQTLGATTFIDAGNDGWLDPTTAADLLVQAGIEFADGFALNVSNFDRNWDTQRFGKEINQKLLERHGITGKLFIEDSSRNGATVDDAFGPYSPKGMRLGEAPSPTLTEIGSAGRVAAKKLAQADSTGSSGPNTIACPEEGQFCMPLVTELLTPAPARARPYVTLVGGRGVLIAWPDGGCRVLGPAMVGRLTLNRPPNLPLSATSVKLVASELEDGLVSRLDLEYTFPGGRIDTVTFRHGADSEYRPSQSLSTNNESASAALAAGSRTARSSGGALAF